VPWFSGSAHPHVLHPPHRRSPCSGIKGRCLKWQKWCGRNGRNGARVKKEKDGVSFYLSNNPNNISPLRFRGHLNPISTPMAVQINAS